MSPDLQHLYVASSQNNEVVEYDYNYAAGTATNPQVIATAAQGLSGPNSMVFSPDGSKLYVANINGNGITQLNPDGSMPAPTSRVDRVLRSAVWPLMATRCWPAASMAEPSRS